MRKILSAIIVFCFWSVAYSQESLPIPPKRPQGPLPYMGEEEPSKLFPFSPFVFVPPIMNLVKSEVNISAPVALPFLEKDSTWIIKKTLAHAKGVEQYDSSKAQNGVTLLDQTTNSLLIDMNGRVLAKFPFGLTHITPNGNMLGASSGNLVKFDADLDLLWQAFAAPHHEITADENGAIYLLSRDYHDFMGLRVNFDMLKIFSADGDLIYEWRVFDHLEEFVSMIAKSPYLRHLHQPYDSAKGLVDYISQKPEEFLWHFYPMTPDTIFEFTHFNSIQVLPENAVSKKIPAFKKGNILLSFNQYGCYGILDTATGKIEWAGYLPERTTLHTPLLTPSGSILVFQNSTDSNSLWVDREKDPWLKFLHNRIPSNNQAAEPKARNWVSITEYDPVTNEKVWEYTADPKECMVAPGLGNAQRLPNGNTLVCVAIPSKGGQVFEITPEKQIVWFYASPDKDTNSGNKPLTFYRATRVSYEIAKKIIPGFKK